MLEEAGHKGSRERLHRSVSLLLVFVLSLLLKLALCSVQEGMVFVSMTPDDLLKRTAQYQIHYSSSPAGNSSGSAAATSRNYSRSFADRALYHSGARLTQLSHPDPARFAQRSSDQGIRHFTQSADHYTASTVIGRDYYASRRSPHHASLSSRVPGEIDELVDIEAEIDTLINNHTPANPELPSAPLFTITTNCDDISGDEEEESSAATLADRYHRNHLSGSYSSGDEDFSMSRLISRHSRVGGGNRRSRKRTIPSRIEPSMSASVPQNGDRAEVSEVMVPHARFFIEPDRSMVSMKFDPPV